MYEIHLGADVETQTEMKKAKLLKKQENKQINRTLCGRIVTKSFFFLFFPKIFIEIQKSRIAKRPHEIR